MKRSSAWISLGCLTALAALAFRSQLAAGEPGRTLTAAATASASPTRSASVDARTRVTDVTSPQYRQWREAVRAAHWGLDSVLEAFNGDLSALQKAVVLSSLEDDLDQLSPAERAKLQERLAAAVLAEQLDPDLSAVMGRLLRTLNSSEQQAELEGLYWELDEQLGSGNKSAIVNASRHRNFVESVMQDGAQPLDTRTGAVERAGELGSRQALREIAEAPADAGLRVTALRTLGQYATDADSLKQTIAIAAEHPEPDRSGRDALAAARVGASESSVPGKSLVLCADWKERVSSAPRQDEQELVRSLVGGKAFARALLSDSDAAAAARCVGEVVRPLVQVVTKASPLDMKQLQLLAELATDLKSECALRPVPSCTDANDPRARLAGELATAVLPLVAGSELEHYAQLLASR